ncbi:MAG: poly-beta-1,6-N-acetyl-D-glucosamine synthase [Candidatus Omnitrophica bacterium]|nr:poly-beta-1,6-N-acetyl-D-glucosamine synthase [Candidatus Omnitrophota bacterium]
MDIMANVFGAIYNFVFYYPLLMALTLMAGGICYRFYREPRYDVDHLPSEPLVSVLIPCHNEESCVEETIKYLEKQVYPNYEIIAIDDGSTDKTVEILRSLVKENPRLRMVSLTSNRGKGTALTMGAMASRGEYLVCIDADALLDPKAIRYFLWHFLHSPRVGAITGNPRVRNRSSVVGKIQVGEFSSIVGMIKRTQRILGKLYTVSGVIAAFRKKALLSVNFWSNDMVTEDIDVSWKLQLRFWDIRYEPRALCWILMPETLKGLWRQRLRWSQGGSEVLKKYHKLMFSWKQRRMWPIFIEYMVSVIWAYCFLLTIVMYILEKLVDLPPGIEVKSIAAGWTGVILAMVCLAQLAVGLLLDSQFERGTLRMFFWLVWYPCIYWIINATVTIFAFPRAIFKPKGTLAVWESPDRGFR